GVGVGRGWELYASWGVGVGGFAGAMCIIGWGARAPRGEFRGAGWTTLSPPATRLKRGVLSRPAMAISTWLAPPPARREITGSFARILVERERGPRLTIINTLRVLQPRPTR